MQFSTWVLGNSNKIKKKKPENRFPKYIFYIRRLFLAYYLPEVLRLPRTRIKSTKMQNSNAKISKHKTPYKFAPGSSIIIFSIVFQLLLTGNHHARSQDMLKGFESLHNPETVFKNAKNVQHRKWIDWEW